MKVDRLKLLSALKAAQQVAGRRTLDHAPQAGVAKAQVEQGTLKLTAMGGGVTVVERLEVWDVKENWSGVIALAKWLNLLSRLEEDDVRLEVSNEKIRLHCGAAKAEFALFDVPYPEMQEPPGERIPVERNLLQTLLQGAPAFWPKEGGTGDQYVSGEGVVLGLREGQWMVENVTRDGSLCYRGVRTSDAGMDGQAYLTASGARSLLALLKNMAEPTVFLSFLPTHLAVFGESRWMLLEHSAGKPLQLDKLLHAQAECMFCVFAAHLEQAAWRLLAVLEDGPSHRPTLEWRQGAKMDELRISGVDDAGEYEEVLEIQLEKGTLAQASYHARRLQMALSHMNGEIRVESWAGQVNAPILRIQGDGLTYVLAPILRR
ncbi:hypothetical protein ACOJUR_08165 [Alicyclobacillus tolerans]|uniref:hypothetical protein n=1 Tax=Alicyclobacillus tolerans TaxID=90970 RepID=UPI003B7E1E7C